MVLNCLSQAAFRCLRFMDTSSFVMSLRALGALKHVSRQPSKFLNHAVVAAVSEMSSDDIVEVLRGLRDMQAEPSDMLKLHLLKIFLRRKDYSYCSLVQLLDILVTSHEHPAHIWAVLVESQAVIMLNEKRAHAAGGSCVSSSSLPLDEDLDDTLRCPLRATQTLFLILPHLVEAFQLISRSALSENVPLVKLKGALFPHGILLIALSYANKLPAASFVPLARMPPIQQWLDLETHSEGEASCPKAIEIESKKVITMFGKALSRLFRVANLHRMSREDQVLVAHLGASNTAILECCCCHVEDAEKDNLSCVEPVASCVVCMCNRCPAQLKTMLELAIGRILQESSRLSPTSVLDYMAHLDHVNAVTARYVNPELILNIHLIRDFYSLKGHDDVFLIFGLWIQLATSTLDANNVNVSHTASISSCLRILEHCRRQLTELSALPHGASIASSTKSKHMLLRSLRILLVVVCSAASNLVEHREALICEVDVFVQQVVQLDEQRIFHVPLCPFDDVMAGVELALVSDMLRPLRSITRDSSTTLEVSVMENWIKRRALNHLRKEHVFKVLRCVGSIINEEALLGDLKNCTEIDLQRTCFSTLCKFPAFVEQLAACFHCLSISDALRCVEGCCHAKVATPELLREAVVYFNVHTIASVSSDTTATSFSPSKKHKKRLPLVVNRIPLYVFIGQKNYNSLPCRNTAWEELELLPKFFLDNEEERRCCVALSTLLGQLESNIDRQDIVSSTSWIQLLRKWHERLLEPTVVSMMRIKT